MKGPTLKRRSLEDGKVPGGSHAKHSISRAFSSVRQMMPCFFDGDFSRPSTASTVDSMRLTASDSLSGTCSIADTTDVNHFRSVVFVPQYIEHCYSKIPAERPRRSTSVRYLAPPGGEDCAKRSNNSMEYG